MEMKARWICAVLATFVACGAWAADSDPCDLAKHLAQHPEMKALISKAGAQRLQQEAELDSLSQKHQSPKEWASARDRIQSCYRDAYAVTTGTPLQPLVQDIYASWLLFHEQPSSQTLHDLNRANAKLQAVLDAQ